jgi:hypothetical protein
MPNINLRDARNRDAVVRADHISQATSVRHVDKDGVSPKARKVLRSIKEHDLARLVAEHGDLDKVGAAILAADTDVDIERIGMFLSDPARVYVNERDEIVYRIEQTEIVRTPTGEEKERRPRRHAEPNVECEFPVSWTGHLVKKQDALRRFIFSSKLQIVHVNGLTYDFLFAMAKDLAEANSLMLLGAGKNGKAPLIFRRDATPYRGFLEGRINGNKYALVLHLSNLELKLPAPTVVVDVSKTEPTVTPSNTAPMPDRAEAPPAPRPKRKTARTKPAADPMTT